MESRPTPIEVMRYMGSINPIFQFLQIEILAAERDWARFAMPVRPEVTNTFGTCHGGIVFAFADICFGFTANASSNEKALSSSAEIHWVAPGHIGDRLIGDVREVWRKGRNGLYDVTISEELHGGPIAHVRGKMRFVGGTTMPVT